MLDKWIGNSILVLQNNAASNSWDPDTKCSDRIEVEVFVRHFVTMRSCRILSSSRFIPPSLPKQGFERYRYPTNGLRPAFEGFSAPILEHVQPIWPPSPRSNAERPKNSIAPICTGHGCFRTGGMAN